jgi:hypothetical protein
MGTETARRESSLDRGVRRLMVTVGLIMMATPSAEFFIQLSYDERPHLLLLSGLFLVGLLSLLHALLRRPLPLAGMNPPDLRLRAEHTHGEPVWSPDPRD